MSRSLVDWFVDTITHWLIKPDEKVKKPRCDFERLHAEIRPGDVLLVEGRSRVSEVIRIVSQSPWTHTGLYLGRLHDIENPVLRERVKQFYTGSPDEQLIIESVLGKGTIISPLRFYQNEHVRICRPQGLTSSDCQAVIGFAIGRLGIQYDIRHIIDLSRFFLPWSILPRRWRSSLFEHHAGTPTRQACSVLIAEAFMSVHFPILPVLKADEKQASTQVTTRNPRLYKPNDFDYSPFFEIIKYPLFGVTQAACPDLPCDEKAQTHVNKDETLLSSKEPEADKLSKDVPPLG